MNIFNKRVAVLEMAFLASGLKKAIERYPVKSAPSVLERGQEFIGLMLVGSLYSTKEERKKLFPGGVRFEESILFYSYARRAWSEMQSLLSREQMLENLRSYVQCLRNMGLRSPLAEWDEKEVNDFRNLRRFLDHVEVILVGELNSLHTEAGGHP